MSADIVRNITLRCSRVIDDTDNDQHSTIHIISAPRTYIASLRCACGAPLVSSPKGTKEEGSHE